MNKEQLREIFTAIGPDAFSMSHYELAEETEVNDPQAWKEFLTDLEVSQWIDSEVNLLRDIELKKIISNIANSKSVGQAHIINALSKMGEQSKTKEGPVFIYCYVPLSEEQQNAPNVVRIENDPFLMED